jgi:plastocyanin
VAHVVEPTRHPVWAVFAPSAATVVLALIVLAFGPRTDGSQRATSADQPPSNPGSSQAAGASPVAAGPAPASTGPQDITIEMGDYFYRPAEVVAQPGELRLTITNLARRRHTLNIQDRATGADLFGADLGGNQSTTMSFTPPAEGIYRIYCNITDHAERGQVGTLNVSRSG